MNGAASFGERLHGAFAAWGRLCVGIDPHASLLDRWGLDDSAEGVREFGLRVVGAAAGRAGIVKPQVAFYERHGAAGYVALERVLAEARDAGLLVIADVKRGDIGSTAEAYAEGHFALVGADAITVNPYLGRDSLDPYLTHCRAAGKGIFVLVKTSNPGSSDLQDLWTGDSPLSRRVAKMVKDVGADPSLVGACGLSCVGAVTGRWVDAR